MENREQIEKYVENKLTQYAKYHSVSDVDIDHVVNMGVAVLETRHPEIGPGYSHGDFVNAIIGNDLEATFARADSTNRKYILFYLQLLNSFRPYNDITIKKTTA